MWYRIELNRDGSVASCVEVESSFTDASKQVHYVEASSKSDAVKILLDRYNRKANNHRLASAKLRKNYRDRGICYKCKNPHENGTIVCRSCHEKQKISLKGNKLKKLSDAEKIEAEAKAHVKKKEARKKSASDLHRRTRVIYTKCLDAFDSMTPNSYRTWLAEQLKIAQEKELANAQRRSRLAEEKYATAAE